MLHDLMFSFPEFVFLGAFAGFCAGLLGIGGGIILVPGLYFLLPHAEGFYRGDAPLMQTALATSMAVILPTGLSSSWAQIKREAVDFSLVRIMAPGLALGVVLGLFLVARFDGDVLKFIFAVGLYGVAASIAFRREDAIVYPSLMRYIIALPMSTLFGMAATFLGMGGAILNVPYLVRAGVPLKKAIGTGSFLGVIVSFVATAGYVLGSKAETGLIHLWAVLMIVPASVMMAPLGVRASHALPVSKLKIIFSILLVGVASKMLYDIF